MFHKLVYEVLEYESAVGLGVLLNERNDTERERERSLIHRGIEPDAKRWEPVSPVSFANGKYQVVIAPIGGRT